MWCARTDHRVKRGTGRATSEPRWLTRRPCCHDDDPVTSRDKPGFMGDPHSKNNRHRPALPPSHRPFSPFAFSAAAAQTHAHTHACTRSSTESPTPPPSHISQHPPFSLRDVSFFLSISSAVALADETGGYCRASNRSCWIGVREEEAKRSRCTQQHSNIPCYRLTSDEKCMYKCTKLIVCCFRHFSQSYDADLSK